MLTSPPTGQFYGSLKLLPTPDLEGPLSRSHCGCRRGSHIHVAVRPAEKDECRTVVPGPCAAPEACGHCSLSGDLTDAALPKWREGSLCAPWTPSPAEAGRQSAGGEGCGVRRGRLVLDARLLLLFQPPPPCLTSSDLQRRPWGLPGLGAACLGCSASEGRGQAPPHPPPACRIVRGLTCAAGKGRPWNWS